MITMYRIQTIIYYYLLRQFRNFYRIMDLFYWTFFDIILWGFTGKWIQAYHHNNDQLILMICLSLWYITQRANLEIPLNLLEEIWSRNIANLFATPLMITEWLTASMILGFLKALLLLLFSGLLIFGLFDISILTLGWLLVPAGLLLLVAGWAIGLLTSSILIYWGQRLQIMVWIMAWLFAPLSGVFYPVAILPQWLKVIAYCLPMTYVFETIRTTVVTGIINYHFLGISLLLNCIYLFFALLIFNGMVEKSKVKGLARLENE